MTIDREDVAPMARQSLKTGPPTGPDEYPVTVVNPATGPTPGRKTWQPDPTTRRVRLLTERVRVEEVLDVADRSPFPPVPDTAAYVKACRHRLVEIIEELERDHP
jgi:hypothetical protein